MRPLFLSAVAVTALAALAAGAAFTLRPLPATAGAAPAHAMAADRAHPTVIELFTSQGCSSCPPANAELTVLSARPDILALSFGVTYWDDLGWKDTFAQKGFTDRQRAYESGLHADSPYTPQLVVNGAADAVGSDRGAVERLIARQGRPVGPDIQLTATGAAIAAAPWSGPAADVWLVRYDPDIVQVPVRRGENGGRTLPHKNVVRSLTRVGAWSGKPLTVAFGAAPAGLSTALLVQRPAGIIVAAARN